ncbi:hypothetical protein [Streptomyces sp. NPDC058953]|uniref:hypothetical protein n=1 Tax=unclassified Streptomyces TaxID=2593676 RepID=UPI0036A60824
MTVARDGRQIPDREVTVDGVPPGLPGGGVLELLSPVEADAMDAGRSAIRV